ncbi:MAG TPA: BREX-1 system adenine-specific DNA-methyltransferase PglX [Chloroflexi bacterium]|nr:BREX-1 system adenine-specific DNA-methyltransferase PglX [Chloroflexota bacterium]
MDTKQLEKFAQAARRQLHEAVAARLDRVLSTDSAELRAKEKMIAELEAQIAASSREAVVEKVAYTWFNRFCALRYMDVNHYTRIGAVSPAPGFTQPEILQEAKQGVIDEQFRRTVDAETVTGLLSGRLPSTDPQHEAYRLLLVGVCNAYHRVMPFMFEKINDYTELLMPDDLLSAGSILQAVREALTAENCADVEVIGWLYQFYISEKKDAVMDRQGAVPSADIPAVTQLFTPHWIVRYMVENSLGRLWMLNHPDSRLVERMDYYIAPEEEITGFLRVTSPEEIRLCDPAAGSGHILTYAFDLLYAIYEEQGYNPTDIPRLILERNLTGIEIDPRAGALAGFALMMKARERDARFFRREVQPDICMMEDVSFTPQELDAYMDAVGRDLFTQNVQAWLRQFEAATTFGSLIRPLVTDTATIRQRLEEVGVFENLFLSHTNDKLRAVLRMTEALRPRYHVVVANPPYMGSRSQPPELKRFLKDKYEDFKSDLFSAFVVRNLDLALSQGQLGLMTPFVWMFISSYEDLRRYLIDHKTITSLVQLEYSGFAGATVPICTFTLENSHNPEYEGGYIRLSDFRGADNQAPKTKEAIANPDCGWFHCASAADFKKIPGAPIAYWVSGRLLNSFEDNPPTGNYIKLKAGMSTGDNTLFQRLWSEVEIQNTSFETATLEQTIDNGITWYPCHSGGQFRKWYGNHERVVNWYKNGAAIRKHKSSAVRNETYYFRDGITWTKISSGKFAARWRPKGFLFDDTGRSGFSTEANIQYALGLLCSTLSNAFLQILAPTLSFTSGDIAKIPFYFDENVFHNLCTEECVAISKHDWDAYETSWDFTTLPLLDARAEEPAALPAAYLDLRARWRATTAEMQRLEEENNRLFIQAYGLEGELSPEVPLSEVTLTCNPHYRYGSSSLKSRNWVALCERFPQTGERLAQISLDLAPDMPEEDRLGLEQRLLEDTMKEFISYAVGCMFGRYSLDKPGLILANQGETLEDYLRQVPDPTFMPDEDNVIPILDGDWFADDITERFKTFLRVTFGAAHYEENLAFLELALGRDVRGYFLRNFYADHVRTYSKRPIYWLFSSPNGSFNALVYLHRYRPDTVSIVLNDYLREFRTKLQARRSHLAYVERSAETAPRDKTQAVKEIARIDKVLNELREYEDQVLFPLATRQVQIDLDDGVLVNYNKLGKALARVSGLSGKSP